MSKLIKVSISLDDAHIAQIEQVAQNLQSSGMNVERTLPSIGIVCGSVDSSQIDCLSQVEGVESVEPERNYQLPPPNSPIQ